MAARAIVVTLVALLCGCGLVPTDPRLAACFAAPDVDVDLTGLYP